MKRTKKDFLHFIKTLHMPVVGEFENQYREEYVICKLGETNSRVHYVIAGDETDWEIYSLSESYLFAYKEFLFNEEEIGKIKEIVTSDKKVKDRK